MSGCSQLWPGSNYKCADPESKNKNEAVVAETIDDDEEDKMETDEEAEPEKVEIDPLQSLFDRHLSASVEANVERMYRKYGFFVPDREFCSDLEGLVGYLHERVKLGHMCIYCHRVFTTWQGCQKHMISKQHSKIRYEAGIDLEDLSVFYDFKEENERFLQSTQGSKSKEEEPLSPSKRKAKVFTNKLPRDFFGNRKQTQSEHKRRL